ncbi:proliferating cell nuclear antigen (pcna) [Candidatus Woesearchaeota archaeon]|nr:proliferating cell nuclear antigen (pcna) [Candidatus Woesearchaeota archaeon]
MKLTLAEPSYLKESISIISDLVNEARFKITKDAVELVAMDPANVAMVIFKLLSSCFTEYDVKEDAVIAINLGNLKQVLRRASPSDMLSLELESNKLKVQLRGATTRTFNLPTIELEEREQKIPELKFPVSITLPSSILTNAIEDADIVAESVSFEAEKGKFTIRASGDLSEVKVEIAEGDTVLIQAAEEKTKSKYSIEYLKKMIGGSKLSDNASVYFNKDYPLKVEFKELDRLLLSFILAPRVEND